MRTNVTYSRRKGDSFEFRSVILAASFRVRVASMGMEDILKDRSDDLKSSDTRHRAEGKIFLVRRDWESEGTSACFGP